MASNPNPARISPAMWRLWEGFEACEPGAELGGIYAAKAGYHNCRSALPPTDYSVEDVAADRKGPSGYAAGIDLTMSTSAMKKYTSRLDTAARGRDVRLYTSRGPVLREFIGTKDGANVYCYVLVGGKPLGVGADAGTDSGRDDSHLWHLHLSVIRQFCDDWPALSGVLSVLKGESLSDYLEASVALREDEDFYALIMRVLAEYDDRAQVAVTPDGRVEPNRLRERLVGIGEQVAILGQQVAANQAVLVDLITGVDEQVIERMGGADPFDLARRLVRGGGPEWGLELAAALVSAANEVASGGGIGEPQAAPHPRPLG